MGVRYVELDDASHRRPNHWRPAVNKERIVWPFGVGFFIACLLFAAIAAKVKLTTPVPAIDADRAAVRAKALAEMGWPRTKL